MKILITGGSGFIGSHCVDELMKAGHDVTVYDFAKPVHTPGAKYVEGDLLNFDLLDGAAKGCDLMIHAGGMLGTHETVADVKECVKSNVLGITNVLEAITKHNVKLVNISKPNVWLNPYSITKDCAEKLCFMYVREFDAEIVIVKLFNVYGSRQKFHHVRKAIPTWIVDSLNGKEIEVYGTGKATVDLVHAKDVARGISGIIHNFEACRLKDLSEIASDVYSNFTLSNAQILELGSGEAISVNKSVELVRSALGFDTSVEHLPMRKGEIDQTELCADLGRLVELTGFVPQVSLADGMRDTVRYYKENLSIINAGEFL